MSFNKKHVDCFIIRAETKFHGWSFYRIMRPLGEREGTLVFNINITPNTLSSTPINKLNTYIWII